MASDTCASPASCSQLLELEEDRLCFFCHEPVDESSYSGALGTHRPTHKKCYNAYHWLQRIVATDDGLSKAWSDTLKNNPE